MTFGGTAEWAAADWLRAQGFHVRFFAATSEIVGRLIDAGIGFVVSWDDDESGHAVAIIGVDHAAGTALAHDPVSFRGAEYLLKVFEGKYSPIGVLAMAAVPNVRANALDEILPPEAEVTEAAQAQQKALEMHGPSAARPIVAEIEAKFPDHEGTQYLRAIQHLADGRTGKALKSFRTLIRVRRRSGCGLLALVACWATPPLLENCCGLWWMRARFQAWTRRMTGPRLMNGTFTSTPTCFALHRKPVPGRNRCCGPF